MILNRFILSKYKDDNTLEFMIREVYQDGDATEHYFENGEDFRNYVEKEKLLADKNELEFPTFHLLIMNSILTTRLFLGV